MAAEPFPFATVQELRDRWPDMPPGSDEHAGTMLKDASQFILDMVPSAVRAEPATRRRVVCAVVRRSMQASAAEYAGLSQFNAGGGPFQLGGTPANPHGDFYLTKGEKVSLGHGRQRASEINMLTHLHEEV